MREFKYTRNDVDYYLEAYSKIKRQLNIYLRDRLSSDDTNGSGGSSTNANEDILVSKLSDYDFEKDRYALKCVDILKDSLDDVRDKKILQFKYSYNLTVEEVAQEVCYHPRTVIRRLQSMKDKLYNIMNS